MIQLTLFGSQKAQILLNKRIGVKINMKKHDKRKQGIAGSVSSRNCVKERKIKPKEMKNTGSA